jgi:hypothetical protein
MMDRKALISCVPDDVAITSSATIEIIIISAVPPPLSLI